MSTLLILLLVLGVALVALSARVVWREVHLFRAAKHDRPATLEGGGSHLSTRR